MSILNLMPIRSVCLQTLYEVCACSVYIIVLSLFANLGWLLFLHSNAFGAPCLVPHHADRARRAVHTGGQCRYHRVLKHRSGRVSYGTTRYWYAPEASGR